MTRTIVLVVPQNIWISKEHLPSIGLASIAAQLERDGLRVAIVDCQALDLDLDQAADAVCRLNPDAVGLTATSHSRFWAIRLARHLKANGVARVFAGGVHFGLTAMDALSQVPEIDVVVMGEGETTTRELLHAWFDGRDLGDVRGIAYRTPDGQPTETGARPFIADLDALPDPAWHCFEMDRYHAGLEGCPPGGRAIGVMSSRGCPFGCEFCANKTFWHRRLRHLSPERFVNQLGHLHRRYRINDFDFWDDTFTVVESHVREICHRIVRSKMAPRIYLRSRVDTVSPSLLEVLKEAGGVSIGYGVESGSQRILDAIAKGLTVARARETIQRSIDLGFYVKAFFMTSLPGETIEDIQMTMDLVDDLKRYGGSRIQVNYGFPTTIYPGTGIEARARADGLLKDDFSWNRDVQFPAMKALGLNPTLPCFENPGLPLRDILEIHRQRRRGLAAPAEAPGGGVRKAIAFLGRLPRRLWPCR